MHALQKSHDLFCILKQPINLMIRKKLSSSEYCLDSIKKYDYENFVCTLLLKKKARSNAIAIRAFNVEVSRIPDQVSDPKTGFLRMKFWEDALQACFSTSSGIKVPNHPVALELYRAIGTTKFTKRHYQTLIQCRKHLLTANSFASLEAMEKYAEQSVSTVYYLLLEGSDITNVNADHAASHLGKAQGLCQLLRSVPVSQKMNFLPLPIDLLTEYGISHEQIIRGKIDGNVKDCIFKIASRANQHLEKSRSMQDYLSTDAKSILLPAVIVNSYLQRLLRADCDIFHKNLQSRQLMWIPNVWWKNVTRTY